MGCKYVPCQRVFYEFYDVQWIISNLQVKQLMEATALSHPEISFSLRNDNTGKIVLQTNKKESVLSVFTLLYGTEMARALTDISITQDNFIFTGYISKEASINKQLQFFFINRRPILKSKFHKVVNYIISKKSTICRPRPGPKPLVGYDYSPNESPPKQPDRFPVYVIHLECPFDDYDITFEPRKTLVEFKDWSKVLKLTKDLVYTFLRNCNLLAQEDKYVNKEEVIEINDAIVKDALSEEQSETGTDITLSNYDAAINTNIVQASLRSKRVCCHQSDVAEEGLSELNKETSSTESDKVMTVSGENKSLPGQCLTSGGTNQGQKDKTLSQHERVSRENDSPNFLACSSLGDMLATQENELPLSEVCTEDEQVCVVLKPKTALMQEPPTLTQMLESDGSQLSQNESRKPQEKPNDGVCQDVQNTEAHVSSSFSSQGSLQSFREYFSSRGSLQSFRDYFKQKHLVSTPVPSGCDINESQKLEKKNEKQGMGSTFCFERFNKARLTLLNPPTLKQRDHKHVTEEKSPKSPYFSEAGTEQNYFNSVLNKIDDTSSGSTVASIEKTQDRKYINNLLIAAKAPSDSGLECGGKTISNKEPAAKGSGNRIQEKFLPVSRTHTDQINYPTSKSYPSPLSEKGEPEKNRKRIFLSTESFVQTIHDIKRTRIEMGSGKNQAEAKQVSNDLSVGKNAEDSSHVESMSAISEEVSHASCSHSNNKEPSTSRPPCKTAQCSNSAIVHSLKDFDKTQVVKELRSTEFHPSVSSDLSIEFVPLDLRETKSETQENTSSKENENQGVDLEPPTNSNSNPTHGTQEFEIAAESQGFCKADSMESTQPFSIDNSSVQTLEPPSHEITEPKRCSTEPANTPNVTKKLNIMSTLPFTPHDIPTTDKAQNQPHFDTNTSATSTTSIVDSAVNNQIGSGWFNQRDPNTGEIVLT